MSVGGALSIITRYGQNQPRKGETTAIDDSYNCTIVGRSVPNSGQTPTRDKTSIVDYSAGWHLEANSFHQHVRLV